MGKTSGSRWVARAAVAVLAVTAAACGGDGGGSAGSGGGDGEAARTIVLAAAARTTEAESSRLSMRMVMEGVPGSEGPVEILAEGAYDYAARSGRMTMTMPAVAGIEIGEIELLILGSVIYERFPPALAAQFGGKPWLKIDLAQLGEMEGIDLDALLQSSQGTDPTQALAYLRGASDEVTVVGEEEVRGERTTRYRATVDADKAVEAAPAEQREAIRQAMAATGVTTFDTDVWIDGEGRLRRMTYALDLSNAAGATAQAGMVTTTVELFDFGTDVDVAPPPEAEVTDLAALVGAAG